MKAKEYAKQYQDNPTTEMLSEILVSFFREAAELAEVRHVQSDHASAAILTEQKNKWAAFCRLCPDVPAELFESFIEHDSPAMYKAWKAYGR